MRAGTERPNRTRPLAWALIWTARLISGLVMGLAAAALIFAGPWPFYVLVTAVALVLSWEWGRLVHGQGLDAVVGVHLMAAGVAAVLAAFGWPALSVLILVIGAILVMVQTLGGRSIFAALGVFYAGLPAVSIIWLRSDPDYGLIAVVFLVAVVVTTELHGIHSRPALGRTKAVAQHLAPQDLVGPDRRRAGERHSRQPVLVCAAAGLAPAPRGRGRPIGACGAGWRSCRIGLEATFQRQGYGLAHPWPRRRDGPGRWAGRRGLGSGPGGLADRRALAGARAAVWSMTSDTCSEGRRSSRADRTR